MTKSTIHNKQEDNADLNLAVQFDMRDFEKRLADVNQKFHDELKQSVCYKEPGHADFPLNFNIPEAAQATTKKVQKDEVLDVASESGLLASLALEARQNQQNREIADQNNQARNQRVDEALDRIFKFFIPYVRHVNNVEPAINRIYRLDARSVFANLKWQGGLVNSRKQNLSDSALRSYVAFGVNFLAPEPVLFKRPWGQFEAIKKELQNLKIRTWDDLDEIHKKPKQEWLETYLDPALPVQIIFQGNYDLGKIDILTHNLADFGQTAFRLEPENMSAALLDELGLFLIGRADKPPVLMCTPDK
jgi:hypothetical protein